MHLNPLNIFKKMNNAWKLCFMEINIMPNKLELELIKAKPHL